MEELLERLKNLPPDGSLSTVTERKNYNCNIAIIKCPENLRSELDPIFHFAIIDRDVTGTNYSGNAILDKIVPGLPEVKVPKEPEQRPDTPPPVVTESRPIREKKQVKPKSWPEKPLQSGKTNKPFWSERPEKHSWKDKPARWGRAKRWTERTDKPPRTDKIIPPNVDGICPWENGKQPWNNTIHRPVPLNNTIHGPVPLNPMFRDVPPNSHEGVNVPVNDYFDPLNETYAPDYYHGPGAHCGELPPPKYPKGEGLLGNHPPEFAAPGHYRNSNPRRGFLKNKFRGNQQNRGARVNNDYRCNVRNDDNLNNTFHDMRGMPQGYQKVESSNRPPLPLNKRWYQDDEMNSDPNNWNGNEAPRPRNQPRGRNLNQRRNSYNRGRNKNYRPRDNFD